jgi:hypothetical protein
LFASQGLSLLRVPQILTALFPEILAALS